MANLSLPLDLGIGNYDIENGVDTSGLAQAKNFPVGAWEIGIMVFVGVAALAVLGASNSANRSRDN